MAHRHTLYAGITYEDLKEGEIVYRDVPQRQYRTLFQQSGFRKLTRDDRNVERWVMGEDAPAGSALALDPETGRLWLHRIMFDAPESPTEANAGKLKTPRGRLFAALTELADEVGQVPGLALPEQRVQAVIDVVNALFPKPEAVQLLREHRKRR